MKSGHKTLNTTRQNSSKAAVSVNTARPINIAYLRPTVNCARPSSNVFNSPKSGPSTALKMTVPSTTEEKICKKNDVKARSLLLMALPNEYNLTFNQYVDAQSMFITIKARFGGNCNIPYFQIIL
ncbi:hypothetical protein Tco_1444217 [Tanacetum coccineum]